MNELQHKSPSFIVVQMWEEHVLFDGFGESSHGFVVFRNDLHRRHDWFSYRATHRTLHPSHTHTHTHLPDVRGGVLLGVDLSADGSSPPAALHHGVHGRRRLVFTRVWARAGFLLAQQLLGFLLMHACLWEVWFCLWGLDSGWIWSRSSNRSELNDWRSPAYVSLVFHWKILFRFN